MPNQDYKPNRDYKPNQYGIQDLLVATMLLAVAMLLVPIAMNPPMYFLWLPIGLTVVFSTALVVAGRRGAKRAVLATAMALIVLFVAGFVPLMFAWYANII